MVPPNVLDPEPLPKGGVASEMMRADKSSSDVKYKLLAAYGYKETRFLSPP